MTTSRHILFATSAIICMAAAPAAAQVKTFDIPAQAANSGIAQLGRQADVQIGVARKDARGKRTNAVRGQMTVDRALGQLLQDTGLIARATGSQSYTVIPSQRVAGAVAPARFALATTGAAGSQESGTSTDGTRDAGASDEIVVTAQKKVENIQDVPASISVIGGQRLERSGATQLADYSAYVPGLVVDSGGTPGQARITLRGLPPITSTTMVGTYVDDSPLGSSAGWVSAPNYALDLLPYDVDRVEVLRGPQGTLYGANTMGGLIKYVTKAPDLNRFSGRAGVEALTIKGAGDLGWGVKGSVNLPIVAGKLAARVSLYNQMTPGFIDNGQTGEKDENGVRQTGGRIAVLWQPTDRLSVRLSALVQDIDADGNATVSLVPGTRTPIYGGLTSKHVLDQPFKSKLRYYTGTLNWDLGWADLVSASSYSRTKIRKASDSTAYYGSYFPIVSAALPGYTNGTVIPAGLDRNLLSTDVKKFTQEFRLSSPAGQRLEWLIGAFYTDEDSLMLQEDTALDLNKVPVAGAFNPFAFANIPTEYREMAVFANATYKFSDAFDISLGGRFAKNKQDFTLTAAGPVYVFFGIAGTTISKSKEDVFTYSVAPRWHINADTMVYARVASGYRPGGPNSPLPGIPPQVNSDRITNYELGLKSEFLDRRAMIDVALFRVDWTDIQAFGISSSGVSYLANGGKARSQGVEFNASFTPVRALRIGFNTAYTDAELIDPIPSLGGLPGDQLSYAPKWSGAITLDHQFDMGNGWNGEAGGGIRYVGNRKSGFPAGSDYFELADYVAVDLHAGISNDRWGARLFVRNATDKRAYVTPSALPGQDDWTVLQPRTIGLSLEAKF
jgi:iron complex outermembrane receptor protein